MWSNVLKRHSSKKSTSYIKKIKGHFDLDKKIKEDYKEQLKSIKPISKPEVIFEMWAKFCGVSGAVGCSVVVLCLCPPPGSILFVPVAAVMGAVQGYYGAVLWAIIIPGMIIGYVVNG